MQTAHKSKELGWQGSEVSKGNSGNGRKLVTVGHCSESGHVAKSAPCGSRRPCEACEHTCDSKKKVVKWLKNRIE